MGQAAENQVIFANDFYKSFNEASEHSVNSIKDGDTLWVYVKLEKPLKEYLDISKDTDADGNVIVSESFHIVIAGKYSAATSHFDGFANDRCFLKGGTQYFRAATTHLDIKPDATEFALCLSEYKRKQSSPIMLQAVGNGAPGLWENAIRFFTGKGGSDSLFAAADLLCDVEDGVAKYRKAFNAYKEQMSKGDIEDNNLPPKGKFKSATLERATREAIKEYSISAETVYFTLDDWKEITEDQYVVPRIYKQVYGVVIYRKGEDCFYSMVEATQNFAGGTWAEPIFRFYDRETPISIEKANQAATI